MSIISIIAIVGLSLLGVGYGILNDNLNLDFSIATGYITPEFKSNDINEEGNFSVLLSGDTCSINGTAYPGTNENVSVKIINNGSLPIVCDNELIGVNEMINHNIIISIPDNRWQTSDEDANQYYRDDNIMKNSDMVEQEEVSDIQKQIYSIQEEINNIQKEMDRLNTVDKFKFRYEIPFEQGI